MIYKSLSILYYLAMALIFIGVILLLTETNMALVVYSVGVIPIVGIRIYNRMVCQPEKQRINTILVVSSLFLLLAGVSFYLGKSYWIVFVLITAMLDFYSSFRKFK